MLKFNQSVVGSQVLATLQNAAQNGTFGGFQVDPDSIKEIAPSPTTTSTEGTVLFQYFMVAFNSKSIYIFFLLLTY